MSRILACQWKLITTMRLKIGVKLEFHSGGWDTSWAREEMLLSTTRDQIDENIHNLASR